MWLIRQGYGAIHRGGSSGSALQDTLTAQFHSLRRHATLTTSFFMSESA